MSQAQTTIPSAPNSGTKQFLRKVSIIVGPTGTDAALELSALRCTFSITSEVLGNPAVAKIQVYNLSEATMTKLINFPVVPQVALTGGSGPSGDTLTNINTTAPGVLNADGTPVSGNPGQVILSAGYEGNFGIIFKGDLMQVIDKWESPTDKYAWILAADGDWGHTWGTMNVTLSAGWTPNDVNAQVKRSLAAYNISVGDLPDSVQQNPSVRGKACFGMTRDTVSTLKTTHIQDAYVHQGAMNWLPVSAYKPGEAVAINAASGMIGVPTQTPQGIEVQCLLNPSIGPGTLIQINNKDIQQAQFGTSVADNSIFANAILKGNLSARWDGLYKVFAVDHVGDTRGNEWYTHIQAMALNQQGPTKAALPVQYAGYPIWQQ